MSLRSGKDRLVSAEIASAFGGSNKSKGSKKGKKPGAPQVRPDEKKEPKGTKSLLEVAPKARLGEEEPDVDDAKTMLDQKNDEKKNDEKKLPDDDLQGKLPALTPPGPSGLQGQGDSPGALMTHARPLRDQPKQEGIPSWSERVTDLVANGHVSPPVAVVLHELEEGLNLLSHTAEEYRQTVEEAVKNTAKAVGAVVDVREGMTGDLANLRQDLREVTRRATGAESSVAAQGQELAGVQTELRAINVKMGSIERQFELFGAVPDVTPPARTKPPPGWSKSLAPPEDGYSRSQAGGNLDDLHSHVPPTRMGESIKVPSAKIGPIFSIPPVTASHSADPIPGVTTGDQGPDLGPYCPGLQPLTTMVPAFKFVIDYRMYRLANMSSVPSENEMTNMYRFKKRIDALYTTLGKFDGSEPIAFLNFITTFREALNGFNLSEGIGVRMMSYFLELDAETAYETQVSPGTVVEGSAMAGTWPHVVNMFLQRYLTDEVLQAAYDKVTRATQNPGEDELQFAQRVMTNARKCRHVFTPAELVQNFVRGLHEATRHRIQTHMRTMSVQDRSSMIVVRQLAFSEGEAQRVLRSQVRSPMTPKVISKASGKVPAMLLAKPSTVASTESTTSVPIDNGKDDIALDPVSVVDTALALQGIFMMTTEQLDRATQDMKSDERDVMRPTQDVPELTDEQIHAAQSVIPNDYWQLACWTCREDGHSTFTCKYLTAAQRIFFAYKYYLHQIEANPLLKEWYRQKMHAMKQAGPEPGPRPPNPMNRGRGGFMGRGGQRRGPPRAPNPPPMLTRPGEVHIISRQDEVTPPTQSESSSQEN